MLFKCECYSTIFDQKNKESLFRFGDSFDLEIDERVMFT